MYEYRYAYQLTITPRSTISSNREGDDEQTGINPASARGVKTNLTSTLFIEKGWMEYSEFDDQLCIYKVC